MSGLKRVLRALRLDKIAAVDFPCQEHASADILKRADAEAIWKTKYDTAARDTMAAAGEAMEDGSYPIKDGADLENAIHAVGRGNANSHDAIRAHIVRRAKALDLADKLPETWSAGGKMAKAYYDALRKVGLPIAQSDEDEGAETFTEALQDQQLSSEFWSCYYQGTQALEGALLSILKDDTVADKTPLIAESIQQFAEYIEAQMPGDIGKSLAAGIAASAGCPGPTLSKGTIMSDELKKALGLPATATEADVLKAVADKDTALAKAAEDLEKATCKPGDEPDEDDMKKALADGSAFRTPEGIVITKKAVGDAFAVLKSQNERLLKTEDDLRKARDREEEGSFAKRAETLGFGAEFGTVLRKAYGGDAEAQAAIEKRIQGLQEQVATGDLYKNFGHAAPAADSATAEFMAKVAEVQKAHPGLTEAQAYTRAYTDRSNAPIVKRMKTEAAA